MFIYNKIINTFMWYYNKRDVITHAQYSQLKYIKNLSCQDIFVFQDPGVFNMAPPSHF